MIQFQRLTSQTVPSPVFIPEEPGTIVRRFAALKMLPTPWEMAPGIYNYYFKKEAIEYQAHGNLLIWKRQTITGKPFTNRFEIVLK